MVSALRFTLIKSLHLIVETYNFWKQIAKNFNWIQPRLNWDFQNVPITNFVNLWRINIYMFLKMSKDFGQSYTTGFNH